MYKPTLEKMLAGICKFTIVPLVSVLLLTGCGDRKDTGKDYRPATNQRYRAPPQNDEYDGIFSSNPAVDNALKYNFIIHGNPTDFSPPAPPQ